MDLILMVIMTVTVKDRIVTAMRDGMENLLAEDPE